MAEPEVEAAWRAEFKRIGGEAELRDALNSGSGFTDELKRQSAFRWLGDCNNLRNNPECVDCSGFILCRANRQFEIMRRSLLVILRATVARSLAA